MRIFFPAGEGMGASPLHPDSEPGKLLPLVICFLVRHLPMGQSTGHHEA